jgi:hypothetical protein
LALMCCWITLILPVEHAFKGLGILRNKNQHRL